MMAQVEGERAEVVVVKATVGTLGLHPVAQAVGAARVEEVRARVAAVRE